MRPTDGADRRAEDRLGATRAPPAAARPPPGHELAGSVAGESPARAWGVFCKACWKRFPPVACGRAHSDGHPAAADISVVGHDPAAAQASAFFLFFLSLCRSPA